MKQIPPYLFALLSLCFAAHSQPPPVKPKPLLRDFIGLNVHFKFKPKLYQPVCRLLRNYHNIAWDYGDRSLDELPSFPLAANRVNWDDHVYGKWKAAGYETHASIQFGKVNGKEWAADPQNAFDYGKAFAAFFGPSGTHQLVPAAEIGNEPVNIDDPTYRTIFAAMAKGLRAGDPKLKIVTATAAVEPDKWSKPLALFEGLEDWFDVINVHKYPAVTGGPTWERSYPEDPRIDFRKVIRKAIEWRDRKAPGKEVWLTEFGYDACTDAAMKKREKPFERWQDVSDTNQAQWIVRSFLVLSAMDLDRAYLYFYNDQDKAGVHAASGITRNMKPKPSFYAMAHLYDSLGDFRFRRSIRQRGGVYIYEFVHRDGNSVVWAAWCSTGSGEEREIELGSFPGRPRKGEYMPLSSKPPRKVSFKRGKTGSLQIRITESPAYLWFDLPVAP